MICCGCRCPADWCPPTDPLMQKSAPPSLKHTDGVMNSFMSHRCIFTAPAWLTCTPAGTACGNQSQTLTQSHVSRWRADHTCVWQLTPPSGIVMQIILRLNKNRKIPDVSQSFSWHEKLFSFSLQQKSPQLQNVISCLCLLFFNTCYAAIAT